MVKDKRMNYWWERRAKALSIILGVHFIKSLETRNISELDDNGRYGLPGSGGHINTSHV